MIERPNHDRMAEAFDAASLAAMHGMIEAKEFIDEIERELVVLGPGVVRAIAEAGVKFRSAGARTRISELSDAARAFGIEKSPGELGLFIPFDAAVYIIEAVPGVVDHEAMHAFDFAMADDPLGGVDMATLAAGIKAGNQDAHDIEAGMKPFRTLQDKEFAKSVRGSGEAPSLYAMKSDQEFWAEAGRAYCNLNDTGSLFDEINAPKYRALNRSSYAVMLETFHRYNGRRFEQLRYTHE